MLDSTARAERIELSASESASYTWEVAQKPVAVRLPLTVIDRLEHEAVETFRSLTSRGSEIGGLLLGSAAPGNPALVTVADFELIPCEYSRGPLYRLSDADLGRFEQAIEKYGGGNGPRVVGYFRSHTRKGLALDAEDLSFFEPRFLDPHHIVLLIRPFATKVSMAGIFIRENGRLGGDASYREFTFRSSELAGSCGGEQAEPGPSAASGSPTAVQPAMPPKPQTRAQIVPIASRREITLPDPVVSTPVPPLVAERAETPVPAAPKAQVAAPVAEKPAAPVMEKPSAPPPEKAVAPAVEKPSAPVVEKAVAPAVEKPPAPVVERAAAPAVEKPSAPPAEKTAAPPVEEDKAREKAPAAAPAPHVEPVLQTEAPAFLEAEIAAAAPRRNKKLRLTVAAAIMLLAVGGGLVVYPTVMKRFAAPAKVPPQDSSPLSLRVERTSGGMLLTWNRDLPVIQSATKVVLSISDGDRHENIQLDPNQVRTGSILYPPITGDVSFQMEVTDPHQSKTTSESLRVLDPRPSPLNDPSAAQPAAKDASASATKPATPEPAPAAAEEAKPVEETPAARPSTPLKPFNTASLAERLRPPTSTDLPDAPAIVRASPANLGSLPGFVGGQTQQAPPPPKPPASSTSAAAPAVGGQLISAKVISRVDPEYPKLARQAGASGVVELEATISADGKVTNPRVIRGNSMLQKAAIDAVMQWHYKPAMLNGKPVASPVEIKLNFVAAR